MNPLRTHTKPTLEPLRPFGFSQEFQLSETFMKSPENHFKSHETAWKKPEMPLKPQRNNLEIPWKSLGCSRNPWTPPELTETPSFFFSKPLERPFDHLERFWAPSKIPGMILKPWDRLEYPRYWNVLKQPWKPLKTSGTPMENFGSPLKLLEIPWNLRKKNLITPLKFPESPRGVRPLNTIEMLWNFLKSFKNPWNVNIGWHFNGITGDSGAFQ